MTSSAIPYLKILCPIRIRGLPPRLGPGPPLSKSGAGTHNYLATLVQVATSLLSENATTLLSRYERPVVNAWSLLNVICYVRVCHEQFCYDRGLFWQGTIHPLQCHGNFHELFCFCSSPKLPRWWQFDVAKHSKCQKTEQQQSPTLVPVEFYHF